MNAKAGCLKHAGAGARAKQIAEARQAIDYRLKAALERLTKSLNLLPGRKRRRQASRLSQTLTAVRSQVEALYRDAARRLKKSK